MPSTQSVGVDWCRNFCTSLKKSKGSVGFLYGILDPVKVASGDMISATLSGFLSLCAV